ncbi:hypothetical protein KC853_02515, partial [Candidatus Saccharibacteria bacterium]|nr:hypothetical protein [Candidatus Saccharibacteria bacterium]
WFKRRRYGYGWIPVTREGWIVVVIFLVAVISGAFLIGDQPDNELTPAVVAYLATVAFGAIILIWISYKKGPRPKWRWGKNPDDHPEEDW